MVIAIIEPVFAGLLVSLLNKYVLSGQLSDWLQRSCGNAEEGEEEDEVSEPEGARNKEHEDGDTVSRTSTSITDASASVHVHCH